VRYVGGVMRHAVRNWGLVAAAFVTLVTATTSATTMRRASVEDLTKASDVIVRGRVVSVTPERRTINGHDGIYTTVRLLADEWWLGEGADTVELVVHGGRVGGDVAVVHGQATFTVGESVVVFLFRGGDVLWPTGMSQGKWRVTGDAATSAADASALDVHMSATPETLTIGRLRERVRAVHGAPR
jgi:hypothetical protein